MKLAAITLAGTMAATAVIPVTTASAHDRHNWRKHHGHAHNWNKRAHRKFHNRHAGVVHHRRHHGRVYRDNDTGELIAAGIIGLAIGAIIASAAEDDRNRGYNTPSYTYSDPYDGYSGSGRVPLNDYNPGYTPGYSGRAQPSAGPNVITYEDTVSLEPWSPGWRAYCEDRYRSFNPQTGTYRGYDGLDHFCVPR